MTTFHTKTETFEITIPAVTPIRTEPCYLHWHHPEVVKNGLIHCSNCSAIYGEVEVGTLERIAREKGVK